MSETDRAERERLLNAMRNGAAALRTVAERSELQGYPDDAAHDREQAAILEAAALALPAAPEAPQPVEPTRDDLGYAIALQIAIEFHCRGEVVPPEIARSCPFHAQKLNDNLAPARQPGADAELVERLPALRFPRHHRRAEWPLRRATARRGCA